MVAKISPDQTIQVLSKYRPFLSWMKLNNPNGVRIGQIKIPDLLVAVIIALPILDTTVVYFLYCYDEKFNFDSISETFPYFIGSSQMSLVYLSLAMKKRIIVEAVESLQAAVTAS